MSLEVAIQENTAALRELIAAISKGVPVAASTVAAVVNENKNAEKPKADAKKQTGSQSTGATSGTQTSTAQSDTGAAGGDDADDGAFKVGGEVIEIRAAELDGITDAKPSDDQKHKEYHFAKFAVLALSKHKGRPMVEALLSRFGVQKGPDLKPEQYARFIKDVDRVLVGEYDPHDAEATEESLA